MSTGRNPEPPLDPPPDDWPERYFPKRRQPQDDAEYLADLVYATGTALSSFGAAQCAAERAVCDNVDAPLERFRADSARGF